jgi:hypothetical protein
MFVLSLSEEREGGGSGYTSDGVRRREYLISSPRGGNPAPANSRLPDSVLHQSEHCYKYPPVSRRGQVVPQRGEVERGGGGSWVITKLLN